MSSLRRQYVLYLLYVNDWMNGKQNVSIKDMTRKLDIRYLDREE